MLLRWGLRLSSGREEQAPPLPIFVFALVIEVKFAVIVDNGQSRTPVPTNKVFVLAIEMKFAVGVVTGGASPSPTNVDVRFGDRGEV